MRNKEELKVKAGDKVFYYNGHCTSSIETVSHITPTGRIRLEDVYKQFDKYGQGIGENACFAYIRLATEEDFARMERERVLREASQIVEELYKNTMTYETAVKILKYFKEGCADE